MSPTDPPTADALVAVIITLQAELETQRLEAAKAREEARREIRRLVTMVEGLTKQLDALLRDRDEERRAELAKLREEAKAALDAASAASPTSDNIDEPPPPPPKPPPNRDKHGRKPIPPHVPRDTTEIAPQKCPRCGGTHLNQKKVLVSEEWDYVQAHLRCHRIERTLADCLDCGKPIVPEQPPMPFDRASCTFAMMAWLCFAKASLFLPLDRVRRDFEDQGVRLASSTLTRWQQRGADLLLPIAESVRLSLLAGNHIRTDGTGLLVVFPRVKGKPVKGEPRPGEVDENGYLLPVAPNNGQILVFGDDEHAVFHYTSTRHGYHAMDFLTLGCDTDGTPIRWKGTITADALSAHDCLFADGQRIEAGCNSHGLRKFRDEEDKAPLLASRALAFIGRMFTAEAKAKERGLTGAALLAHRTKHAAPVAADFKVWLNTNLDELLLSNPIRKAMNYYLNHWDALTRFLVDPAVEMENNWSERALRTVNLVRNNSLYAGGEDGALRLCTLLTLITTCRQIKVNPFHYLEWALSKVVPHSSNRGLAASDLTPAAYKTAQERDAQ